MATQKILTRDFFLCFFSQVGFSAVFFTLTPTIPIYLSRLGSTEARIGILIGALSVSSLILRPLVGRALLKIPERSFMIAGTLIYAFSSMAYLIAKPFCPFVRCGPHEPPRFSHPLHRLHGVIIRLTVHHP